MVAFFTHLGIVVVCVLLARVFPYRPPAEMADAPPMAELARRYHFWYMINGVLSLVFAVLGILLWFFVLEFLQARALAQLPPSRFVLHPTSAFFFLPSGFLGLFTAMVVVDAILVRGLRERYHEYKHFEHLSNKISRRATNVIVFSILGLSTLASVLLLDTYTCFRDDRLVQNTFFGFGEEEHSYGQIRELRENASFRAPSGADVRRLTFQIVFADGYTFSSRSALIDEDPKKLRLIWAFVSTRCGQPVTVYEREPE